MSTEWNIRRVAIPGLIGNVLEWYDFALYGYFAPVIAKLFFPTDDQFISLLTTFAVFAVGFIMRPLGAIIFGHFGDRYGRKKALAAAVLLMAIPTTLMGLLPSYASIGIAASLLLTFFRLLQGLAVGGEFTGSIVYILEHAPANRRGFYGSLAMSSAFVGLLLGSGIAALVGMLVGGSELETWAWRIPFVISIILGVVGLYLRYQMPETPVFVRLKQRARQTKFPVISAVKSYWRVILKAIGLVMLPSLGFYLSFVYLPTYLNVYHHVSLVTSLPINTLTMAVIIIASPVFGFISDNIGRWRVLLIGGFGFLIFSVPLFLLLQSPTILKITLAQLGFGLLVAIAYSAVPAILVELFSANVRYTAMSLPYNLANAIFGGTAPLMATSLIYSSDSLLAPGFYLMLIATIMLSMLFFVPETYQWSINE